MQASTSKVDPVAGLQESLEQLALAVGRLQNDLKLLTQEYQKKLKETRALERKLQRALGSASSPEDWPLQHCAGCGNEIWLKENSDAYPYVVVPVVGGDEAVEEDEPDKQPADKQPADKRGKQLAEEELPLPLPYRVPSVRTHTTRGKLRKCSSCGNTGHNRARCPVHFPYSLTS